MPAYRMHIVLNFSLQFKEINRDGYINVFS